MTLLGNKGRLLGAILVAATTITTAKGQVTFSGSETNAGNGDLLSASVTFSITNGNDLVVSLSNRGGAIADASDVLTVLYFDSGLTTLKGVSAVLGPGSSLLNGPPLGGDIGDNWEYVGSIPHGSDNNATDGIGATGFNVFGQGNFGPSNTTSENVDGVGYGIVGGSIAGANDHIPTDPFESNTVVFTLSGLPNGYSLTNITDVQFQYGTMSGEPYFAGMQVPEPSSFALLGLGAVCLARRRFAR